MSKLDFEPDGNQWIVAVDGDIARVASLVNGGTYAIPTTILRKTLEICDRVTINEAMMQTEGAEECKCVFKGHVSCQNTVTRGQVFANRMRYFENYPDSKQYMVDFLKNKKVNK